MEKKKKKVLVVGELNVDIIYDNINGMATIGKEIIADDFTFTLGSSSAIFACNLSTLGSSVSFIGKVGNDDFAKTIKSTLSDKGVNTDHIITSDDYSTGSTIVLNYNMDRAMVTYPGAMERLLAEEVTSNILEEFDHLHVSSVFLQKMLKPDLVSLFEKAKSQGLTTSLDPQWDPSEQWDLDLDKLLPHVDVFLPNKKEFLHITKSESLQQGLETISTHRHIIIKDGEHGAHCWDGHHLTSSPAFLNAEVSDCIGAGDSFDAGFIHLFLKGGEVTACIEQGNIIGAINTTHAGGTGAFKSKQYIQNIAKEKFSFELA